MARVSDLIRDSRLETHFLPDCSVATVHTYQESDLTSRRRVVARSEHWQRLSKIGGGAYGSVWLEKCTKSSHRRNVHALRAVKQIDLDTGFGPIDYNRELEAIAKFSHARYVRCFVRSFGWYESPDRLFIAMEYLELGDLHQYLHDKPALPETEAKEIAFQILEGLSMMHENDYAHRDLKPRNILINAQPPDKWWIKVAGFGISKRIEEGHGQISTLRGTPGYIAPELWQFIERGTIYATDIWATGEILFEMLTKMKTFAHLGLLSKNANQETFPSGQLVTAGVSNEGVKFVSSLMKAHPNERLTAKMALSHEWLASTQAPVLEDSASEVYIVKKTPDLTPVQNAESSSGESLTEEFAAWDTEELTQKTVQPHQADHGTAVSLNHRQAISKKGTALDKPQFSPDQTVTIPNKPTISGKPVAIYNNSTLSSDISAFDNIIPLGKPQDSPGSANSKDRATHKLQLSKRAYFTANAQRVEEPDKPPTVFFGVQPTVSLKDPNVAVSLISDDSDEMITVHVPIIVAKCCEFLRKNATDGHGIFLRSGSVKEIKEFKLSFNSPPRYGQGLDWSGYGTHDVANLLIRYLVQLPEPVVPLDFYKDFFGPLNEYQ